MCFNCALSFFIVNDAPALNAANVGIAMGSGTAVAQQASDMVIVDDNFVTIVHAIELGRGIYSNITKFVNFIFGSSIVQVIIIVLAVIINCPIPLSPLSILYVNLTLNGLNGIALSVEGGDAELMLVPPRDPDEALIRGKQLIMFLVHAFLLLSVMLFNFLIGLWWFTGGVLNSDRNFDDRPPGNPSGLGLNNCRRFEDLTDWIPLTDDECRDGVDRAKTMLLLTLVFTEIFRGYTVRNYLRPIWSGLFQNKVMALASLVSLGLVLIFILVDDVSEVFDLSPDLPYYGWLVPLGSAIFVTFIDEMIKLWIRRRLEFRTRWRMLSTRFDEVITELRAANAKIDSLEQFNHRLEQKFLANEKEDAKL